MWIWPNGNDDGPRTKGTCCSRPVPSLITRAPHNQVCRLGKEASPGVRRGRPVCFPLSPMLPGGLLLYHKWSLLHKTLQALSFWKPEVCENKE